MTYTTSHIEADRSIPLLDLTVGDLLRRSAELAPDHTALVEGTAARESRRRYSYAQLLTEAEAGARALLGQFQPGEHVAIIAPNMAEWTLFQLSAALAGLVIVTINPVLRPNEVRHILVQSDTVGVFAADRYRDQDLHAMVTALQAEMQAEVPLVRQVFRLADWAEFARAGATSTAALPVVKPHDHVMIQYTSGTTGAPKGALLHHFGLVNSGLLIAERLQRGRDDVWLNPMPMFHTGGCVMGTLGVMASLGSQVVMPEFDPALMLRLIEEERATYTLVVPTMAMALMEHPNFDTTDLSSLQLLSSGATTVPPELVRRIEARFGVTFNMVMGQTESGSVIFMSRLDASPAQKGETLGVPLAQWETKIADETGEPVPIEAAGEICCRGFGVMAGYFNMPEATAQAIDADGWLHTGDIGVMAADGYTRITGRVKDMIIRGGENIFPREIEDVLITHEAIADAAVLGVPDEKWGEQPVAFLRLKGSERPSDLELTEFLRERIARHKVPREWFVVDAFPMNASGKVQKFLLRERYAAERGA